MEAIRSITRAARISECGQYRFTLSRMWGAGVDRGPFLACFIGLNPSTADAEKDDQTIRKLIGFSQRWGLDGFTIVNLFALRSRDPKALKGHAAPCGPGNDEWIIETAKKSDVVVACWGNNAAAKNRGPQVAQMLKANRIEVLCLGKTGDGHPKHPLMLAYDTAREKF